MMKFNIRRDIMKHIIKIRILIAIIFVIFTILLGLKNNSNAIEQEEFVENPKILKMILIIIQLLER